MPANLPQVDQPAQSATNDLAPAVADKPRVGRSPLGSVHHSHERSGFDLLVLWLQIPQALRYTRRFLFIQVQPEMEGRGGFHPISSTGWVSTAK
jgi:hypothetical protein